MASGNGARIVPPSVPMTITQIGAGELVLEPGRGHAIDLPPGRGHAIDLEPTYVYP